MSLSAIVVEGGAMRGIFAAGVLDVFLEQGFDPFDLAIGSSAGACNLASHLARQHGRNRRCYLTQMRRREFADGRRFCAAGTGSTSTTCGRRSAGRIRSTSRPRRRAGA